jgi:hypothetical protein
MSLLYRLSAAAAAVALVATPTLAAAAPNPAAQLSVAKSPRAGTAVANKSRIAEGPSATLVNVGILAGLVVLVRVLTGGDDDDSDSN